MKMDKKKLGGLAALVSAMLYGGAQLLDLEARLVALEGLHPEITTGVAMDPHAVEDPAQEAESPEADEEPDEEPESAPEPAEAEAVEG